MELLCRSVLILALLVLPVSSLAAEALNLKFIQPVLTDDKEGSMKQPEGVACSNAGALFVADSGNGRLLKYTYVDGVVAGGTELKMTQLPYPGRMQMNSQGEIYVLDGKLRRIAKLNPQGGFVGYLELQGVPGDVSVVPRSFKIGAGNAMYLLDIFSERVLLLDAAGTFQKQINFPVVQGARFFSDLAVTANGDILLVDSINSIVYVAARDAAVFVPLSKSLRSDMDFPVYVTTDSRGFIYLVDQNGGGIIVLGQDGSFRGRMLSMGWKPGLLSYPSQLCFTDKGTLFVADRNNSRLQIFEFLK